MNPTSNNDVTFLIDGARVYDRVIQLFDQVTKGHGGYVHMFFWDCDKDTALDGLGGGIFSQKVQQLTVPSNNNEFRLNLWRPGSVASYFSGSADIKRVIANNDACDQLEKLNPALIEVKHIEHPNISGSYHEKIMIFCVGDGVPTVIVGGLNISKEYRDNAPHAPRPMQNYFGYINWHDVAVQFTGPATVDVETEYARLWDLAPSKLSTPRKSPGPAIPAATQTITIARSIPKPETMEVADKITSVMANTKDSIYLENYAIHERNLIDSIVAKIKEQKKVGNTFVPILVIPFPTSHSSPYDWLHFATYSAIALEMCTEFDAERRPNHIETFDRAQHGKNRWFFYRRGDWYWSSEVRTDSDVIKMRDVRGYYIQAPMKTAAGTIKMVRHEITPLFTPYYLKAWQPGPMPDMDPIYVHSKVSIFDDKVAGVGSANFNPRSLRAAGGLDPLDGELTAFVEGDSVPTFRAALWNEWGGGNTAFDWVNNAWANLGVMSAGSVATQRAVMLPITYKWFESQLAKRITGPSAWPIGSYLQYQNPSFSGDIGEW